MPSNTPLPSSFDGNEDFYEENPWQKLSRRMREEPLIPLGILATCAALYQAQQSIKKGDHKKTNRMFRYRIYGQGFTIVAMLVGAKYWEGDRKKRKEFEDAVKEQKAKEKAAAWIKELEARDEEEKELQALREKRLQKNAPVKKAEASPAAGKDAATDEKSKKGGILEAVAALGKK